MNKKEKFLDIFEKFSDSVSIRRLKYIGPGIEKKLQRTFFTPHIYFIYLFNMVVKPKIMRIFSKAFKTRMLWGLSVTFPTSDIGVFRAIPFPSDKEEIKLAKFFIKNWRDGDVFYDIGANYGVYTYLASEFIYSGEIHSFEPIPSVFSYLKLNTKHLENNIFLNNIALSDADKNIKLYFNRDGSGSSTLIKNIADHYLKNVVGMDIKTTTLDSYIENHTPPTFIKLDVEGSEPDVINGGINFFRNFSPIIAMEILPSFLGGEIYSIVAARKFLDLGYNSFIIRDDGSIVETVIDNNLIKSLPGAENIIFKKQVV